MSEKNEQTPRAVMYFQAACYGWQMLLMAQTPAVRGVAIDAWWDACEVCLEEFNKAHGVTVAVIRDRNAK